MSNKALRDKFKAAHNRFHGRYRTHAEVAKNARWSPQELENVQIEDEELYYDELQKIIDEEVRKGRFDELHRVMKYEVANDTEYYALKRIAELTPNVDLQASQEGGVGS